MPPIRRWKTRLVVEAEIEADNAGHALQLLAERVREGIGPDENRKASDPKLTDGEASLIFG